MAESAALLVDKVLPHEPMRQWVLSVPFPLRFLFASQAKVMGKALGIVYRTIATHLTRKPKKGAGYFFLYFFFPACRPGFPFPSLIVRDCSISDLNPSVPVGNPLPVPWFHMPGIPLPGSMLS
jgi:hypothetical protein